MFQEKNTAPGAGEELPGRRQKEANNLESDLHKPSEISSENIHFPLSWRIFPVKAGGKEPCINNWESQATNDPEQIKRWKQRFPGCNWGLACGPSGLVVIDVDNKKGKTGSDTLTDLELDGKVLPPTRTYKTPTGGWHYIYKGFGKTSVEKLGPGIDTRGAGGYIVIPPSALTLENGSQKRYQVYKDIEPVPLPAWVNTELGRVQEKDPERDTPAVELDQPFHIADAAAYLQSARPAVEGSGGDNTTYWTACRVRDFGLSARVAHDLLLRFWNPRCQPPWSPEDLWAKVQHAYQYAQNPAGLATAEAAFKDVEVPDEPLLIPHIRPSGNKGPLAGQNLSEIFDEPGFPRAWINRGRTCQGYLSLTFAAAGVGKSGQTIQEGISAASGRDICGFKPPTNRHRALLFNSEDSLQELRNSAVSICQAFGISKEGVAGLDLLSGQDRDLCLVKQDRTGVHLTEDVKHLEQAIQENGYTLVIIDPFVGIHGVNENDNMAIDTVARVLTHLAQRNNCAIHVVHHSRKRGALDGTGDMDIGRGASALAARARIIHTISTMTPKEAEAMGVPESERKTYIRIDEAKNNLCRPREACIWRQKTSFMRDFGEEFMVLKKANLVEAHELREDELPLVEVLAQELEVDKPETLNSTVQWFMDAHPNLVAGYSPTKLARKLQQVLVRSPIVNDIQVSYYYAKIRGRNGSRWVVSRKVEQEKAHKFSARSDQEAQES